MRQNAGAQTGSVRRGRGGALGAAAIAAALLLASCGSSDAKGDSTTTKPEAKSATTEATTTTEEPTMTVTPGVTSLDGSFISTEVTGYDLVSDTELTLTFDGDQLSVNAGCNTMGSSFSLEENVLRWTGEPRATMMACDEALTAQDTWISDLLTAGVDATTQDDGATLVLATADVEITLAGVSEAPITGTTWTLSGTIANDAVSSLPADTDPPTLTIDEDGTVGVFAGCNRGSGTVEVAETTLTFSPIALTKMACTGAAGELETQVITVLDGEVEYTVDGDTLTVMNGSNGLAYKAS